MAPFHPNALAFTIWIRNSPFSIEMIGPLTVYSLYAGGGDLNRLITSPYSSSPGIPKMIFKLDYVNYNFQDRLYFLSTLRSAIPANRTS
jgi:hypothetical protein